MSALALVLAGCRHPSSTPDGRDIDPEPHGQAIISQWNVTEPVKAAGTIDKQNITIVLPESAPLTSVTSAVATSAGASIDPNPADPTDFSDGEKVFTVTAQDGATSTRYTVQVRHPQADDKAITAFSVGNQAGIIDHEAGTITLFVTDPASDLSSLAPDIGITGESVRPESGEAQDFSGGAVEYVVRARDGSSRAYKATITRAKSAAKEITAFTLAGAAGVIKEESVSSGSIAISVPPKTDLANLTAEIAFNGAGIDPLPGAPQNFGAPVTYTVRAEDDSVRVYTARVTTLPDSANEITFFALALPDESLSPGVISGSNIAVTVPYGTSLANMTPRIEASAGAALSPAKDLPQNFANKITYKVTAANGADRTYEVTTTVAGQTDDKILSFAVPGAKNVAIDHEANTITVTLFADVSKTFAPVISHSGVSVSPASGETRDFSSSQTYTVTAANSGAHDYIVTAENAARENVSLQAVTADGASWASETTGLFLTFSQSVSTLTPQYIELSGGVGKGAALSIADASVYRLPVSGIPANGADIEVTVSAPPGYALTGPAVKTVRVWKAPAAVQFAKIEQREGKSAESPTTGLRLTLSGDVPELSADDITLSVAAGESLVKGALTKEAGPGVYLLAISEVSANNLDVTVKLAKPGFVFTPASLATKVFIKASTDATLSALTVSGGGLPLNFSAGTTGYTLSSKAQPSSVEKVTITATANNPAASLKYMEENRAVSSGKAFDSRSFARGVAERVTVEVTAEDRNTTNRYTIEVYRGNNNANLGKINLTSTNSTFAALYPAMASGIQDYTLYANQFVTGDNKITVTPVPEDGAAKVSFTSGAAGVVPANGTDAGVMNAKESMAVDAMSATSKVTVLVTAEDGVTTKEYRIHKYARVTYAKIPQALGGTITFVGDDEVHTFSTGTADVEVNAALEFLMPNKMPATVWALALGGGGNGGAEGKSLLSSSGNGGYGGGGGAGQLVENKSVSLTGAVSYTVKVGKRPNAASANGTDSSFAGSLTAKGGGGGYLGGTYLNGLSANKGKGGTIVNGVPQGGSGGGSIISGMLDEKSLPGGGGAGAGGSGGDAPTSGSVATPNGGAGKTSDITGSSVTYGTGGRGGGSGQSVAPHGNADRTNGNGMVIVRFKRQ